METNNKPHFNYRGIVCIPLEHDGRFCWPDDIGPGNTHGMIATLELSSRKVLIYPVEIWMEKEQKIKWLLQKSRAIRDARRTILGSVQLLEFEGDNRTSTRLTPNLMAHLGHPQKCFLVGEGERLSLWEFSEFTRFINISKNRIRTE